MTVRALGERVEAYFAACDATRERMEQRNGAAAYRQVPYTLAGLAAATGLGKAALLRELAPEAAGEGDERRVVVVLDDREGWSG